MMLWLLLVGHAVTDFPLQGDFLAKAKNHRAGILGVPWLPCLIAHSVICGGAVTLVTGSMLLGLGEALIHGATDWMKNEGHFGFTADQLIHVTCKVVWWAIYVSFQ